MVKRVKLCQYTKYTSATLGPIAMKFDIVTHVDLNPHTIIFFTKFMIAAEAIHKKMEKSPV